jgi:WD40 repeat protein
MDKSQKKTGSPVILFIGALVIILIITLIANHRSGAAIEIQLPLNNGIAFLSTCGNLLTAISNDNRIYICDWADLSKKPNEYPIEVEQVALISPDKTVSIKRIGPDKVVISELRENKQHINISLPFKAEEGILAVTHNKNKIFLLLRRDDSQSGASIKYNLFELLIDSQQLRPAAVFDSEQSSVGNISVSDDGQYIVGVGDKHNAGWIFAIDIKDGKLKWQKEFPEFKKIFKAVLSTSGEVIYARGTDSSLMLIKSNSGEIIDHLLPVKENKSTYKTQPVQTITVSPDGNLVAATIFGAIYIWDTKANKLLYHVQPDHKVMSSITFSGDSRFLATSDMRQGGKIKIYQMPQTNK